METFGILLIAVDDYPDPPGRLPSSKSAKRFAELIIGERGGKLVQPLVVGKSREDIISALDAWSRGSENQPRSSIVYLVGHGTDNAIKHSFIAPAAHGTVEIPIANFSQNFEKDWIRRQGDSLNVVPAHRMATGQEVLDAMAVAWRESGPFAR